MENKKHNKSTDIFEKISVLLSQIENEVSELNECSTSDFLLLNKNLKQQYSGVESVSRNITAVFEITTGKVGKKLHTDISEFYSLYNLSINNIGNEIENKNDTLEEIIYQHKLMYIPLKNYLQNLVTINFLANSLKFNLEFKLGAKTETVVPLIKTLGEKIEKIKTSNTSFDDLTTELIAIFENIADKTGSLVENNSYNLKSLNNHIAMVEKKLNEKFKEARIKLPEIKRIQNQYSQSVSKIIINLQYSDIIRQKIDHISNAQREMLNRINEIKRTQINKELDLDLLKIKDVADLQIAQLIRTSGEYQNAVKIISEKFVDISKDTNTLAFDILHFAGKKEIKEKEEYDFFFILDSLQKIKELVQSFINENSGLLDEYSKITKIDEKYEVIFSDYKDECLLAETVVNELFNIAREYSGEQKEISDVLKQMESVYTTLTQSNKEIDKYRTEIKERKYDISTDTDSGNRSGINTNITIIDKLINDTKEYNKKIKKILLETETVEQIVSDDISKAIKEVKYYTHYEKASSEIIVMMQELYRLINIKHEDIHSKVENLEKHKSAYTMKSERDIHNKVVGTENKETDNDNIEEEIEFF